MKRAQSPRRQRLESTFHPTSPILRHGAAAVLVPFRFDALRVSVTLVDATGWHAIYSVASIVEFELEYGREQGRYAYNQRHLALAARKKRAVVAEFAGLTDLFVPVVEGNSVRQVLVAGPLRRTAPTRAEVLAGFLAVTGRDGHAGDRELLRYVNYWLDTPLFERNDLAAFERLLTCLTQLVAESGDADAIARGIGSLEAPLDEATYGHRMWAFTRAMLDPLTARVGASHYWAPRRRALNLQRLPDLALVGLIAGHDESDPIDAILRRDEFQRATLKMVRAQGNMASSPIGERGVTLLLASERSETRSRAKVADVAERLIALARRHGLKLHVGIGPSSGAQTLPARYQAALEAAETALLRGARSVHAASDSAQAELLVRDLRRDLALVAGQPAENMRARFERYLEVIATYTSYRVGPAAAHLQAGFERLAEPLVTSGSIDPKSFDEMCVMLSRAAESATFNDLARTYRAAISDLEQALLGSSQAHRERNLARALAFIRDHASEPLSRQHVAQIAGFAPNYFSHLFKAREGVTFEAYVQKLRIERAQQMLVRTALSVERIGRLSGFGSSSHFCRAFKHGVGETPRQYRSRPS